MALVGLNGSPIKIGGFKMIDVPECFLIAQVGFNFQAFHKTLIINILCGLNTQYSLLNTQYHFLI